MYTKKGLFYKSSVVLLSLIFIFVLSACGGKTSHNTDERTSSTNHTSGHEPSNTSSTTQSNKIEYTEEEIENRLEAGESPLSISVTKYMEAKAHSYDLLNPLVENVTQMNPMASIAMLPLLSVDMSILPLSMIGLLPKQSDTLWEGEVLFLTEMSGKVEVKGGLSTFELFVKSNDDPNKNMVIVGEYDMDAESLTAQFTIQDGSKMVFEYTAIGDGYISQLYTENEGEHTVVRNAFNSDKMYGGIIATNGILDSIYRQQITDWEKFVENDSLMIVMDYGVGYMILDGNKYDY